MAHTYNKTIVNLYPLFLTLHCQRTFCWTREAPKRTGHWKCQICWTGSNKVIFMDFMYKKWIYYWFGIFLKLNEIYRLRHAQGVEKLRAEGGVSFIYDEPHKFERYHDQRERVNFLKNFLQFFIKKIIPENQRDRRQISIRMAKICSTSSLDRWNASDWCRSINRSS